MFLVSYFNCISTCNSKIYIRTYLYFYILANSKACTQKLFQTLLLHPSLYSIAKNTLHISYLKYKIHPFSYKLNFFENINSFLKSNSLFMSHSFHIYERLLCIAILQFCICSCMSDKIKNATSVYTNE